MDPVAILAIVGSSIGIAKVTIASVQRLYELKERYTYMKLNVPSLVSKLLSISCSLSALECWAQNHGGSDLANPNLIGRLEHSVRSCIRIMGFIDLKVKAIEGVGTWKKIKHIWNEKLIQGLEKDLDGQINALQLLLMTVQWCVRP
jgi:hypothetical protein